jgi:hypothetical protein
MKQMHKQLRWIVLAVMAACTCGCGKSEKTGNASSNGGSEQVANSTDPNSIAKADGPAAAVSEFLEAVRTGNDAKATQMLSTIARQKASDMNRSVTPAASDTARFQIGQIELLGDDGARVACTWIDQDEKGQPQADEFLCVLRREAEGWRIAGMAATIFPGEPPLLLDFEKPDEMLQKQQWVKEELIRRSQQSELQAQGRENSEKSVIR